MEDGGMFSMTGLGTTRKAFGLYICQSKVCPHSQSPTYLIEGDARSPVKFE